MKKQILTLLCVLLVSGNSMFAATWLVQKSGGATWTNTTGGTVVTIGTANGDLETWINSTPAASDEIWIIGNTTFVLSTAIVPKDGMKIYGGFAGTEATIAARAKGTNAWDFTNTTVLDGNDATDIYRPALNLTNPTIIGGFTITRGKNTVGQRGGGALVGPNTTMQNCIVTNCVTQFASNNQGGGGVTVHTAGTLKDSYIYNNFNNGASSPNGGGVFLYSKSSNVGNKVLNCKISNNSATTNAGGLYIFCNQNSPNAAPEITGCEISDNTNVSGTGGGLMLYINVAASSFSNAVVVTDTKILNNTNQNGNGGGYFANVTALDEIQFHNCTISGNVLQGTTSSNGSAISSGNGIVKIYNSTISGNSGLTIGNVLNVYTFTMVNSVLSDNKGTLLLSVGGNSIFQNNTFANNKDIAGTSPIGLTLNSTGTNTLTNCLFYSDYTTNPISLGTSVPNPTLSYSGFESGAMPAYATNSISTISSASFKNTATGDYSLAASSTAIDAGTTIAAITTDILGITRPKGAAYDMGAYEYIPSVWTAGAWVPALNSTENAFINDTYNAAGFSCNNLTVNAGKQFTLASGTLSVAGNLTLSSDATNGTATFVNAGGALTVSGKTNVEQYLGTTRNWYVSSPLSNAKAPAGFTLYKYVEAAGAGLNWASVAANSTYEVGTGYIALPSTTGGKITFSTETGGTINTSDVPVALTATNAGFNLIGNPYPSHLTWTKAFVDANVALIQPTIWYRTNSGGSNTGGWSFPTFNANSGVGTLGATGIIPPMQAFWVKAVAAGTLTLNSSLTKSHQTGNPLKAPAVKNTDRKLLRLEVSNGTAIDEAVVYFDAEALNTYDKYDSPKKFNNSTSVPDIYTVVGNEKLVINGLNQLENNMEMTLGFNSLTNGNFTFKTTEMTNFDANTRVYLIDKVANTETELFPATEYAFASDITANNETRFSILFKAPSITTSLENQLINTSVFVNAANETVILAPENTQYSVYNAVGQRLTNGVTISDRTVVKNFGKAGIYIVKLTRQGQTNSYRLVVR